MRVWAHAKTAYPYKYNFSIIVGLLSSQDIYSNE